MKPHKGSIRGVKVDCSHLDLSDYPKNRHYLISGRWVNHPQFGNTWGHTSLIIKKGRWKNGQCEVETLNSRYTWLKDDG